MGTALLDFRFRFQVSHVINFQTCFYFYVITGADLVRLWMGPFTPQICDSIYFLRNTTVVILVLLITIHIGLRYLFICKWRRMRIMNDDLIVRLAVICTIATALWLSFVKLSSPGRPQIMKVHNMKFNKDKIQFDEESGSILFPKVQCDPHTRGSKEE